MQHSPQRRPSNHTASDSSRPAAINPQLIIVLALALTARMAYFQSTRDSPLFQTFQMDAQWHAEWARQIIAGHWAQERPFFRAPLYPFFLAAAYRLTGDSFDGARVVQHVLGAVTCVLILLIGRRAYGGRAGLCAAVIACFYGPLIHYENELLTPVLEIFLLALFLWLVAIALETTSPWRWLAAGIALGLCCVTRPTFLVLAPVALAAALLASGDLPPLAAARSAGRYRRRHVVCILAGLVLPILPVTLHNRIAGGDWVLIASQGGVNFFIGNNANSDGRTALAPGEEFAVDDQFVDNVWSSSRRVAEAATGRTMADGEVSGYWFDRGLAFWREQPLDAVRLTAKKAYYLLNGFEISSLRSIYVDAQFSAWAGALTWCRGLAFPAGLIVPLGLLGLCTPAPNRRLHHLIRGVLLLYGAAVVLFFVNSRLRMPLVVPVALLAGHALAELVARMQAGGFRRIAGPSAALAVLLLLCNSNIAGVRQIDAANDAIVLGNAWGRIGELERAVQCYTQSVELDPNRPEAQHNLGLSLLRLQRAGDAITALRRAAALAGDRPAIHNSLGTALEDAGQVEAARDEYETALRLLPEYYLAHVNLSRLSLKQHDFSRAAAHARSACDMKPEFAQAQCLRAVALLASGDRAGSDRAMAVLERLDGDPAEARLRFARTLEEVGLREPAFAAYLESLRLNPRNPEAHANLGALLFEMGRLEEARAALEEAIRLRPGFGEAHYNLALLFHRLGDPPAARQHLDAARRAGIQADPGLVEMLGRTRGD